MRKVNKMMSENLSRRRVRNSRVDNGQCTLPCWPCRPQDRTAPVAPWTPPAPRHDGQPTPRRPQPRRRRAPRRPSASTLTAPAIMRACSGGNPAMGPHPRHAPTARGPVRRPVGSPPAGPHRCLSPAETAVTASRTLPAGPHRCLKATETTVTTSRTLPAGPHRCLKATETTVTTSPTLPAGPHRCLKAVERTVRTSRAGSAAVGLCRKVGEPP
jgi:hypothetical protein